jgi:hypothetical protein
MAGSIGLTSVIDPPGLQLARVADLLASPGE